MAKGNRQIKGINIVSDAGLGSTFEHQESYDDSLLPEATELAKLKEVDHDLIQWVKDRTAKEQDSRLEFNSRKILLLEKSQSKSFFIDILTIVSAFLIVVSGMALSYFLIEKDQTITGTIFAGATIVFAANSFLRFRNQQPDRNKEETKN